MRTTTIDPLAEKYYSISPYAWCGNNPVNAIDPDGMYYYDWKDNVYRTDSGKEVSWDEVQANNYREPMDTRITIATDINNSNNEIDNYIKINFPNIWFSIANSRIKEIVSKKINIGTEYKEGMPTLIEKNGDLLVVDTKTNRYISIWDYDLVKHFDIAYSKKHFPNDKFANLRQKHSPSRVADSRLIESFSAACASAWNPVSIPVYDWMFGPGIAASNQYKASTKKIVAKRLFLLKEYGIIR